MTAVTYGNSLTACKNSQTFKSSKGVTVNQNATAPSKQRLSEAVGVGASDEVTTFTVFGGNQPVCRWI